MSSLYFSQYLTTPSNTLNMGIFIKYSLLSNIKLLTFFDQNPVLVYTICLENNTEKESMPNPTKQACKYCHAIYNGSSIHVNFECEIISNKVSRYP